MQIRPPSDTTETELYISNSRIAQPMFTLKSGKLTTQGVNGKSYAGYLGFTISIIPPVLQSIFFGSGDSDFSDWWAAYNCDAAGHQYLELRYGRGKSSPPLPSAPPGKYILCIDFHELTLIFSVVIELVVDLVVEKVSEGQKIKGKPLSFEGKKRIHAVSLFH